MLGRRTMIDYGSGYNMIGTQIGTEVPGSEDDRGSVRDVLGPNTEAGQAFLVAALGFGVVYLAVAPGQRGVVGKVGATLQTVAFVAGASFVANYLTRMYVVRHPNGPLAMGFHVDG